MRTQKPLNRLLLVAALLLLATSAASAFAQDGGSGSGGSGRRGPILTAPYSIHEWGLLAFNTSGGADIFTVQGQGASGGLGLSGTGGLGLSGTGVGVGKPVIYFHPEKDFDPSTEIAVGVALPTGILREVWPTADGGAQPTHTSAFTWPAVKVLVGQRCGRELAPASDHAACASIKSTTAAAALSAAALCEASELGQYLSPVSHCLEVALKGGTKLQTPVLLYNGYLPKISAPLVISGDDVTNSGAHAVGPVYVQREGVVYVAGEVKPSQKVPLKGLPTVAAADLHAVVRAEMVRIGLTEDEARDFAAAWKSEIFDNPTGWAALGIYAPAAVEALAPLVLEPAPKTRVRVLAFRQ